MKWKKIKIRHDFVWICVALPIKITFSSNSNAWNNLINQARARLSFEFNCRLFDLMLRPLWLLVSEKFFIIFNYTISATCLHRYIAMPRILLLRYTLHAAHLLHSNTTYVVSRISCRNDCAILHAFLRMRVHTTNTPARHRMQLSGTLLFFHFRDAGFDNFRKTLAERKFREIVFARNIFQFSDAQQFKTIINYYLLLSDRKRKIKKKMMCAVWLLLNHLIYASMRRWEKIR